MSYCAEVPLRNCYSLTHPSTCKELVVWKLFRHSKTVAACLQCASGPIPAAHSHCYSVIMPCASNDTSTLCAMFFFISARHILLTKCTLLRLHTWMYLKNRSACSFFGSWSQLFSKCSTILLGTVFHRRWNGHKKIIHHKTKTTVSST